MALPNLMPISNPIDGDCARHRCAVIVSGLASWLAALSATNSYSVARRGSLRASKKCRLTRPRDKTMRVLILRLTGILDERRICELPARLTLHSSHNSLFIQNRSI